MLVGCIVNVLINRLHLLQLSTKNKQILVCSLEEVFIGNDLDTDPIKRKSPRYSVPMHSCYVDRKLVADEL